MKRHLQFLNNNGLVNGKIPANIKCPFHPRALSNERCPTENNTKPHPFSCATARAFSLLEDSKKEAT